MRTPLAIYARQSAAETVLYGRGVYDEQAISLVQQAIALGWDKENIVPSNEDPLVVYEPHAKIVRYLFRHYGELEGVEGVNIRQGLPGVPRPGLQVLCERIAKGEIDVAWFPSREE